MKTSLNRRRFLQAGLLGSTALGGGLLGTSAQAAVTKAGREAFDGLKLGIASYTYRKFTLEQAITMTKQAGLKYINLKDIHLPMKSSREELQAAHKKVEEAGLVLMGGGVVAMKNEEGGIRAAFEYARDAGFPTIVAAPVPEALDLVEKMAKEFDIRIAIHNHGPGDNNFPSPYDVFKAVKDRDSRLGLCIDIGHTVRNGIDPAEAAQQCASRLYDLHVKDETRAAGDGKPTEVGRGVIDIVALFKVLLGMKFPYHVGLEYEAHESDPQPGVRESIGYLGGVLAAIG